ncbi:hypothetical protein Ptr902_10096 [Pyrenophora tritici-repentis]|nr:hypothetical protein Ptr902_10096 [Pyrenophora tritici-repentis]
MAQTASFPFMRLPAELRLMVYERIAINVHSYLVWVVPGKFGVPTESHYHMFGKRTETAILRVSRQVYAEAYALMQTNQFHEIRSTPFSVLLNLAASEELKLCIEDIGQCGSFICKESNNIHIGHLGHNVKFTTIMEVGILGANHFSESEYRRIASGLVGVGFGVRHILRMIGNSSTTPEESCDIQTSSQCESFLDQLIEGAKRQPWWARFEKGTNVSEAEFTLEWPVGDYYCTSIH